MSSSRPVLVAYISGHGYGHYTRSAAVLDGLPAEVVIHVRTALPALRLARRNPRFASVTKVDVGPGVAQRGPLGIDVAATREALRGHVACFERLCDEEARFLEEVDATLVYGDVPPLAFAAAARAGVPSVGLSNFTWSWIYDGYAQANALAGGAARLAAAEAQATCFLELEGGGGLEVFAKREVIAPVALPVRRSLEEVRARLGWERDDRRPLVLVSFGGFGAELRVAEAAARNPELRLLLVGAPLDAGSSPGNVRSIMPAEPDGLDDPERAPTHPELVAAADCVIGKPGYGTVAECLRRPTAFVHVPRGDFREAAPLTALLRRWLPSAPLRLDELHAGRWTDAVHQALASRPPEAAPPLDGATQAAARISTLLRISG